MTGNILRYKGYYTRIEYSSEDKLLHGKIEGISDFIDFESYSAESIEHVFHTAVDHYLNNCNERGTKPEKSYSGMFNVRIKPDLHRRISNIAFKKDITLNKAVEIAIQEYANKNI